MKKLLLSCDEYAYLLNGHYFLSEFGFILVQRYLNVFDTVVVAVRTKNVLSEEELNNHNFIIIDKRIQVFPIPFFQGPVEYSKQYIRVNKVLRQVAVGCDAAVLRLPSTVAFACLNSVLKNKLPYGVEIVANPYEFKQKSTNVLVRLLMAIWDYQLKKACRLANAVSYVTKSKLQELYPAGEQSYKTNYSSIEMDSSFFYKPRVIKSNNEIRIAHVTAQIKTLTKGHMTVLKIVKLLKDKNFNVIARFAGEGEYINFFTKKTRKLGILDQIEFVGPLNRSELNEFLKNSNIMVFPSTSEGLPRVLIEAMATGLPCLSTPVGGIPELLDNSLLFNPQDAIGFSEKIAEIFLNRQLYSQLSKQNYNTALEYEKNILEKRRNKFYEYLYNL